MTERRYRLVPYGDAALLAVFGEDIEPGLNRLVHAAAAAVRADIERGAGWRPPIPAYASLLVGYDARSTDYQAATDRLAALLDSVKLEQVDADEGSVLEIRVRYGGEDGPDLAAVAERCGLTPAQVVDLHASVVYRAYMLGFAPGFAYLGVLPAALEVPRLATPRQRVPAGSVAIADRQTAVYPLVTPGGWNLIGRTDAVIWDAARTPPALVAAGASVRFVPDA